MTAFLLFLIACLLRAASFRKSFACSGGKGAFLLFLFCIFLRYLQLNAVCFIKKSTFLTKQSKRRRKDCMNFPPHILPRLRTP